MTDLAPPVIVRHAGPRVVVREREVLRGIPGGGRERVREWQVWVGRIIASTHDLERHALEAARREAFPPST